MGRPRKTPAPGSEPTIIVPAGTPLDMAYNTEPLVFIPVEISADDISHAYSVVNNNDLFQLVRITFNKRNLDLGKAEVVLESTDRYEVYGELTYRAEEDFFLKENL